jgi:FkbM family methyltransferase
MLKSFVRQVLGWGPLRRVLTSQRLQPVWEGLHKFSLYGMNYGGGNMVEESGELWVLKWLQRRHVASRNGTPVVIFDVGAHDGSYSLIAATIFGADARINSFEPSAAAYKTLRAATSNSTNITAHHCGLGAREELATLYYDAIGSQMASVHSLAHASPSDLAAGRLTSEGIQLRTIDAFCTDQGISRIDLLKIDVEGNELNVLRGAVGMIEAGAIGAIQFEFGEAQVGSRTFFKDIYQFLSPHYRLYRILPSGLSRAFDTYDAILEVYRTTNYLAMRRGSQEQAAIKERDGNRVPH